MGSLGWVALLGGRYPSLFIPTKTVSVKPTLESSCWREAVVIGDLDGYTPPSDLDILEIVVIRHLPK